MQRWIVSVFFSCFIVLAALLGATLIAIYSGQFLVPARWNPFAPYDIRIPAGPLTPLQYWRTLHDPQLCRTALSLTDLHYQPLADADPPNGCTLHNVVRISSGSVRFNHPFLASCPLAIGLARFESDGLQAAAQASYGQSVREIDHVGSYACRAVRTETNRSATSDTGPGGLSQHAHANAIDLSGFVLADGREIAIGPHWKGDSVSARFLHAVHAGACAAFNTTLGPDYNALHSAHFHVDMGPYQICR